MVKLGAVRVQPVGLGLAPTIDQRLDQLLFMATQGGRPTTRHRIVGALIHESPMTSDALIDLLDRYERSEAEEALIPGVPVRDLQTGKRPGRRKLDVGDA